MTMRYKNINLNECSLEQVDRMYREGFLPEDVTLAYIEAWNRGPHYTYAYIRNGRIENRLKDEGDYLLQLTRYKSSRED